MKKKKTDPQGQPPAALAPAPAASEPDPLYELGSWAGLAQWRCRLCPWDTLDGESAMLAHLASRHAPGKAQPGLIQTYDRWGNPTG